MELLIGKSWGNALKKNKTLIHIDLSNNHISDEACRMMGKSLKKNHTIFGIHMAGNACYVDPYGHLLFEEVKVEEEI